MPIVAARAIGRALLIALLCRAALVQAVGPTPLTAAAQTSATLPAAKAAPAPDINVDKLLEDPLPSRPEVAAVAAARGELAREGADTDAFEKTAAKLAENKAWDAAIDLLWWAEKMTNDKAARGHLNELMLEYQKNAAPVEGEIDAAMQLQAAGRPDDALRRLLEIRKANPLSAAAHYNIGKLHMAAFQHEDDRTTTTTLPADLRVRVYRVCHLEFVCAKALNPFYIDAWDQISNMRVIFRDHPDFLLRTNNLTQQAADFRTQAAPAIQILENGDRSTTRLVLAGDALAECGADDSAVFAWRAALYQGGAGWDRAEETKKKIDAAAARL